MKIINISDLETEELESILFDLRTRFEKEFDKERLSELRLNINNILSELKKRNKK